MKRNAKVQHMYINSTAYASSIQIGDAIKADPYIRALAVQKEGAFFDTGDFPFSDFPFFSRPFPEIREDVSIQQHRHHKNRDIHVHSIDIEGITGSSIMQVGSLKEIDAKARLKHFRILADENEDGMEQNQDIDENE
ncbi:hypothetical protein GCM10008986_17110 [Salinibacillus aidingensis]|uniref:Spore germination protein PE n=1 Tax=Salinibacillus aidingensis TaxID=237684 RepID=A0ABN1B705_9BACI